jgi:hypothetical protein
MQIEQDLIQNWAVSTTHQVGKPAEVTVILGR